MTITIMVKMQTVHSNKLHNYNYHLYNSLKK
jgi:hypothetical protein